MKNLSCHCDRCQHELCARRVPIFQELSLADLAKTVSLITQKKYRKGEMLLREGVLQESLMIVSSGQVKAYRITEEGKEQILYIFSEGDFFGEKSLLRTQEATYHVEAMTETHICMIQKGDFQTLIREQPDIGLKIIDELSNRLDRLERNIQNMGTKSMEARVSAVLLEFADKHGKKQGSGILVDLPLSREGIANYIGAARETVSRKMSHLQDQGVIEMIGNKKLMIRDKIFLEKEIG